MTPGLRDRAAGPASHPKGGRRGTRTADEAREEASLLARCRAGDETAFAEVVDRHGDALWRIARRILRDEEAVEEAVQDAFVQFHRSLGRFRGEARISTYLYRLAVNAAKMRLRAERRRKRVPREALVPIDPDGHMRQIPDWSTAPERRALHGDLRDVLGRAIAGLPANYRPVYALAEVEGLPLADVGRALGLTVQTVKSRLHRARLHLRSALAEYVEGGS